MKPGPDVQQDNYMDTLKCSSEELGKNYDQTGAICSVFPTWSANGPPERQQSYFCSEFVVTAFQRVGFMSELSPKHTTPNSLYASME